MKGEYVKHIKCNNKFLFFWKLNKIIKIIKKINNNYI